LAALQFFDWLRDHGVLILACLAVIEGLICLALVRGLRQAREGLRAAQDAAEDAVRAAALAAPGAIDPEAVLALLREGHAPTLDNVYAMMRRRDVTEETIATSPEPAGGAWAPSAETPPPRT
jgi:hypothetical protein